MLWTLEDVYYGEMLLQSIDDCLAIRVDHYLRNLRADKQRTYDVVEKRFTGQGAEIFARDALRVMAHGYKGGNRRHITSSEHGFPRTFDIGGGELMGTESWWGLKV